MTAHHFTPLTPVTFLERNGLFNSSGIAIQYAGVQITFADLLKSCRKLASLILKLGANNGDRVGVLTLNSLGCIQSHFAVPGAGAVIVCLNPWLTQSELISQIEICELNILLVTKIVYQQHVALFTEYLCDKKIVILDSDEKATYGHTYSFLQLEKTLSSDVRLDSFVRDENDPIAINFTSGTTGSPKGVIYSHRAAYLHALGQVNMLQLQESSVYFWSLPMFHVNGWGHMWAGVAAGARQIIDEDVLNISAEKLFKNISTFNISHLCGAPRLIRLLTDISQNLSGLIVMTGGAAPTPDLIEKLEIIGVHLIHQYGLNETLGPFVVCTPRADWKNFSSVQRISLKMRQGIPALHAGMGLTVLDANGKPVEWNGLTIGEVVMSGNTLAMGYFRNPEATQKAFKNGWFHSGDMAVVHPDGYLEIKDRIKDLIFVETEYGWENISSIEIENCISRFECIKDVAVIGHVDESTGKTHILAFVETRNDVAVDNEYLYAHCKKILPSYKIPEAFFRTVLPKTATGKIQKNLLIKFGLENVTGKEAVV